MKTIEEQSETLTIVQRMPNALSIARIPLSLSILLVKPFSVLFFSVYRSIIEENAWDFEYVVARLRRVACMSYFRMALY